MSKKILILGAGGGVGLEIAKSLAGSDCRLWLHATSQKSATALKDHLGLAANEAEFPVADFLNPKNLNQFLNWIFKQGGAEVVIQSATLPTVVNSIDQKSLTDFYQHWQIQVGAFWSVTMACLPQMKAQKFGRIIAIASEYSVGRPPAKLADYVSAKAAQIGLIKSLAVELGSVGITANAISAGFMETNLTANLPSKLKTIVASQTPTQRLVKPAEVAKLVNYLISADASMINGENLMLNGGMVMR